MASDKSEKITETYPVWLEGVIILDGSKNKVVKHNKCFSMPEHRGKVYKKLKSMVDNKKQAVA